MKLKKALKLINEICLAKTRSNGTCYISCPLFSFNPSAGCCLHKAGLKEQDFDDLSKMVKKWAQEREQKRQEMLASRRGVSK